MLLLIEGLAMCFLLLLVCVVAIKDGPVGAVYFYEPDVQKRAVELSITTEEEIRKNKAVMAVWLFVPLLVFVPLMVYFINGARGFRQLFVQILVIFMIEGLFDRLFIDGYWVSKTKAWIIPGTEDLMPYIPEKTIIRKWIGTIILYPALAAMLAAIVNLF